MRRESLISRNVGLVDTGYWYALVDHREKLHPKALELSEILHNSRSYLLPWPVMYETLCTRFTRKPAAMKTIELMLKRPNAVWIDDVKYREEALERTFASAPKRALSLVDNILRLMLEDRSLPIDCLYTFNVGDFFDICHRRQIEIM